MYLVTTLVSLEHVSRNTDIVFFALEDLFVMLQMYIHVKPTSEDKMLMSLDENNAAKNCDA